VHHFPLVVLELQLEDDFVYVGREIECGCSGRLPPERAHGYAHPCEVPVGKLDAVDPYQQRDRLMGHEVPTQGLLQFVPAAAVLIDKRG
jgi:hypothetical protein